jgi:hypothetical protein
VVNLSPEQYLDLEGGIGGDALGERTPREREARLVGADRDHALVHQPVEHAAAHLGRIHEGLVEGAAELLPQLLLLVAHRLVVVVRAHARVPDGRHRVHAARAAEVEVDAEEPERNDEEDGEQPLHDLVVRDLAERVEHLRRVLQ